MLLMLQSRILTQTDILLQICANQLIACVDMMHRNRKTDQGGEAALTCNALDCEWQNGQGGNIKRAQPALYP